MRVLLVDNYDSFAFNLVQALRVLGATVDVVRNDAIPVEEAVDPRFDRVVISPGPCTPKEGGISVELCRRARVPLLGVCLGHQCIVEAFGGRVGRARRVVHGKASRVEHDGRGWLSGLPDPLVAARYHSLVATELPGDLVPCARSVDDGELMAVRHRDRPLMGVQFHPESFLTPNGPHLLRNFLESSEP